jgi:hypothetical protein
MMGAQADPTRRIADAVLYEGYILWPYRRSSPKNARRWTFGGVYPPAHSERHPDDRRELQAQCLLEADAGAVLEATVRFLHVVDRGPARRGPAGLERVDELTIDGERHLAWDEAVEREATARTTSPGTARAAIEVPGGQHEEPLRSAGAILRSWEALQGSLELCVEPLGERLHRLTARVENRTPWAGSEREDALRRTFCSTHVVLRAQGASFFSPTDPPDELRAETERCVNTGLWPVLVGDPGDRTRLLSAPIVLSDYPQIAPESPGDLFDATEIDRLLILNVLALTEAERAEVRATDPRAREILDRCAGLGAGELWPLYGSFRDPGTGRAR